MYVKGDDAMSSSSTETQTQPRFRPCRVEEHARSIQKRHANSYACADNLRTLRYVISFFFFSRKTTARVHAVKKT